MVHLTTALEPGSGVPLYEQLYRSLAGEMRSGTLAAGTRMPGKRRLAAELSVSVNTVDAAYQMLAAEGYLEPRERSGFYVQEYLALPERTEPAAPPQPEAAPAPEQPVRYDLSTRGVDPELFPFRTWARLQKELLYSSPELLTHGDAQGDLSLRQALAEAGAPQIRIFAKIENLAGVQALPEFLPLVDEVVIARGDLGNAMPLWELPRCQKQLSAVCRSAGVPFMVVTQMLDSMHTRAVPTRAEVSDIYNAVLDGASSLMLTGETAAGQYPVQAMEYLVRTARTAM